MKKVDITILSWDRLDDTKQAMLSGLAQKNIDGRVIVVDQGSQPINVKQLREFSQDKARLTVIYNSVNLGVPGGRNQAALQGDGDYIVGLDNDAEFIDQYQMQKAVDIMEADPTIGVLGFRVLRFGTQEDDRSSWYYSKNVDEYGDKTFEANHFVGAGHMIRRSAFEQVKGYDDTLFFMQEEIDLSERIINAGYKLVYSPDVVIGHKVSAEHRVNWTGMRWEYNVRNAFYLHIKRGTPIPNLVFHTALLIRRGAKAGMFLKSLSAVWQGIKLIPHARQERKTNLSNIVTPESRRYRASCSSHTNQTLWQRIKNRIHASGVGPGESAKKTDENEAVK